MNDLRGLKFGRLTVESEDPVTRPGRRSLWTLCECGTRKSVRADCLTRGQTVSCGCGKAEHALRHGHRRVGQRNITYTSWETMWQRCTNPRAPGYEHYGGRGISVDPRWKDFNTFLQDMGGRPSKDYQLDRKNNERGYSKRNCRWATRGQQMLNTRRTVKVGWRGRDRALRDLAHEHGMPPALVLQRVKNGWSVPRALHTPNQRKA